MCADPEPFGVVSGDVLHGLRAEAGRGLAIDDGDVGTSRAWRMWARLAPVAVATSSAMVRSPPMVGTAAQVTCCSSR